MNGTSPTARGILDRRSIPAAAAAAFAESGILFLPMRQLLLENGGAPHDPLAIFPVFVALFVGTVAAGLALGRRRGYITGVAVGALTMGALEGGLGPGGVAAAGTGVVLALLAALRAAALIFRDWQDPVSDSFAIGSLVLLVEVMAIGSFDLALRPLLSIAVPQFFVGMLASRAASVRLVVGRSAAGARPAAHPRVWRPPLIAVAALVLVMIGGALLSGRGGALQALGRVVFAMTGVGLGWIALVVARVLLPPLVWIFARLHLSLRPAQQALRNFAHAARGGVGPGGTAVTPVWARVVGLAVTALLALVLIRAIRRSWRAVRASERRSAGSEEISTRLPVARPIRAAARRFRRELPANTIRRWYAETLVLLESKGLARTASSTPGEFLRVVARANPECAAGFGALTRAYEDVRYGRRELDRERVAILGVHHGTALASIRKMRRVQDDPAQAG